jgi:hypothetical protein
MGYAPRNSSGFVGAFATFLNKSPLLSALTVVPATRGNHQLDAVAQTPAPD